MSALPKWEMHGPSRCCRRSNSCWLLAKKLPLSSAKREYLFWKCSMIKPPQQEPLQQLPQQQPQPQPS